jgi:hypothetical protein
MFMRVSDLLKENQHLLEENQEIKQTFQTLQDHVKLIFDALTPEEIDEILEEHKLQLEYLAKASDKKSVKEKKRKR